MRSRPLIRTSVVAAVSLFAAGCGGGSSTVAGSSAGGGQTRLLAYASCMRSHGVLAFPDPGAGGEIPKPAVTSALRQVANSRAQAAQSDCGPLLPAGGSLSGQSSQPVSSQQQQDYLRAAACMRSHGITGFPDPTFAGGTVKLDEPSSVDTRSTQFTQAAEICTRLIPAGLPYSHA